MKFINFILSFYIVALSCVPCADLEVNSLAHSVIEVASATDGHSHDKESDLCPPFCSCACCGTQIASYFETIIFDIAVRTESITTQLPTYTPVFTSNFHGSIWQPPQIA